MQDDTVEIEMFDTEEDEIVVGWLYEWKMPHKRHFVSAKLSEIES